MSVIYNKVALIGLGLIAGSIALAAREAGVAGKISGTSRSAKSASCTIFPVPSMANFMRIPPTRLAV